MPFAWKLTTPLVRHFPPAAHDDLSRRRSGSCARREAPGELSQRGCRASSASRAAGRAPQLLGGARWRCCGWCRSRWRWPRSGCCLRLCQRMCPASSSRCRRALEARRVRRDCGAGHPASGGDVELAARAGRGAPRWARAGVTSAPPRGADPPRRAGVLGAGAIERQLGLPEGAMAALTRPCLVAVSTFGLSKRVGGASFVGSRLRGGRPRGADPSGGAAPGHLAVLPRARASGAGPC